MSLEKIDIKVKNQNEGKVYYTLQDNPFDLQQKKIKCINVGQQIKELPDLNRHPVICLINGKPVLRKYWDLPIRQEDKITVVLLAGDSDVGKAMGFIVVGIAIAVFGGGLFIGGGLAGLLYVGGAVAVYGVALLIKTMMPEMPSHSYNATRPNPSYNVSAQGNRARLGEAIPVIYGKMRVFPDFVSTPYYLNDNNVYLYLFYCIGQGNYDIENVYIGDTNFKNFTGSYKKIYNPNGVDIWADILVDASIADKYEKLYPAVFKSPEFKSLQLYGTNMTEGGWSNWYMINDYLDKIILNFTIPQGLYTTDKDDGSLSNHSITLDIEWEGVYANGSSYPIDVHHPTGTHVKTLTKTFTAKSSDIIRWVLIQNIDDVYNTLEKPEAVRVRCKRNSYQSDSYTKTGKLYWDSMFGVKQIKLDPNNPKKYVPQTLMVARLKATKDISNEGSSKISVILKRKIPVYDETTKTWTTKFSDSIAWVLCDILRNSRYGAGLNDDVIDLDAFVALDKIWTARGDSFNGVFDRQMDLWSALQLVARAGRATLVLKNGKVSIVRDKKQTVPLLLFNNYNIVKNSLKINYSMLSDDTHDGFKIRYADKDNMWREAFISKTFDDKEANNPVELEFFGCTNSGQAGREALYMARNKQYRRISVQFTTELEGFILTFGDYIRVSHDVVNWGVSGSIVNYKNTNPLQLVGDVKLSFSNTDKNFVGIKQKDGSVKNYEVKKGDDDYHFEFVSGGEVGVHTSLAVDNDGYLVLTGTSGVLAKIYIGSYQNPTNFAFGQGSTFYRNCVVKDIVPKGDNKVQITGIVEDERVHSD